MNMVDKIYSNATLDAIQKLIDISQKIIITVDIIRKEWEKAVNNYTDNQNYIKKGCPKTTFLGLCFSGKIKNLNIIHKKFTYKNSIYGIVMLNTLQNKLVPELINKNLEFWKYHVENYNFPKTSNHQYIIVKTLYYHGYILENC